MKIAILTAMDKEHAQILNMLKETKEEHGVYDYTIGTLGNKTVVLSKCGIGKVNAAIGTAEIIRRYKPDAVVSTGCAGGIDKCLNIMDVVVSSKTVHHDFFLGMGCEKGEIQGMPRYFPADEKLIDAAKNLNDPSIHIGLICTGDQFITSKDELARIKGDYPEGLAVDMESVAIAQTCYVFHVPFVSFRVISDTPGADEHQQQYDNFWSDMAQKSFETTKAFLLSV